MTSSNTLQAAFQQVEKYHPKQIKALVLACPHIDYFKKVINSIVDTKKTTNQ